MARRVVLHVGMMKSGTTSLQQWCDLNVERLREAGVLWSFSEQNFAAVKDLLGGETRLSWQAGSWERLSRRIAEHPGDALISNEILSFRPAAKIGALVRALAPAEVRVVVTVRDLLRTVPSQWQEGMRNGQTFTLDEFTAALCSAGTDDGEAGAEIARWFWRRQDVVGLISRWRRHVPLAHITVVTVPAPGSTDGLLEDRFAAAVGFDATGFDRLAGGHVSLGAHSAELMRRLNARAGHLDRATYREGLHDALADGVLVERAGREPTVRLPAAGQAWARDQASVLVARLTELGVPVVGDLGELSPPPADDTSVPVATTPPTEAELTDVALDGLVGVAAVHARLRRDYERLVTSVGLHLGWEPDRGTPRTAGEGEPSGRPAADYLVRKGRALLAQLDGDEQGPDRDRVGSVDEGLG